MRLTLLAVRASLACLTIACAQGTATDTDSFAGPSTDDDFARLDARIAGGGSVEAGSSGDDAALTDGLREGGALPPPVADGSTEPDVDAAAQDAGGQDGDVGPELPMERDAQVAPADDAGEPALDAAPVTRDAATAARDAAPDDATPDAGSEPATFGYVPSNVELGGLDFASAPAATLGCGVTQVDTSGTVTLENWCGTAPKPIIRGQSNGPELAIIPLSSLTLPAGNTLRIVGSRPLALMVQGAVTIAGTIDLSARETVPGPGGNSMCDESKGGDGSGNGGLDGAGGGGGGFGTTGGFGGDDVGAGTDPGDSGRVRGNAMLVPLLGGCSGGRAGGCPGTPGAGAGTMQLSASRELVLSGSVLANGGAGAAGCANDAGGTGGGSGGGILLEADALRVNGGQLRAEGGRGGNGQGGAMGGAGAASAANPGARGADSSGSGGGGGGGGFGRIRLRGVSTCTGC